MAQNYSPCLISAMDRFWFHQIILRSHEPVSSLSTKTFEPVPELIPKFHSCPSSTLHVPILSDNEEDSSDDSNGEEEEEEVDFQEERKPKSNDVVKKSKTHLKKHHKNLIHSSSMGNLSKSVATSKSLGDLELEEVKGFIDLGFKFRKENVNPKMICVVPGLKRLIGDEMKEEEEKEEERGTMRPYLSEAWTMNRPNSRLLNLRIPKVSSAVDMKKHLRFWAKTVASEVQKKSKY